jgi:hypothetical protein
MTRRRVAAGVARAGLVAKGLLYALLAVVVLKLALPGGGGEQADSEGALRSLTGTTGGTALLAALAFGFGFYALWQGWCVINGEDTKARLAAAGRGLLWAGISFNAGQIAMGAGKGGQDESSITATVLNAPFGTWIVAAVGVAVIAVAAMVLRHVNDDRHMEDLRPMPQRTRKVVATAATVGIVAKTLVYGLAGAFLIRAAVRHEPNNGVGLDGALSQIAKESYGVYVLSAAALGMAAYAVWCGLRARYEDLERSDG